MTIQNTEEKREQIYYYILLVLCISIPIQILMHVQAANIFLYSPRYFTVALFIGTMFPFFVEPFYQIVVNKNIPKIIQKDPFIIKRVILNSNFQEWIILHETRASELSFSIDRKDNKSWFLNKVKASKVHYYSQHGFAGVVNLKEEANTIYAEIKLTLKDTLLFETTEQEPLNKLGAYLIGSTDSYIIPKVPYTLICSIYLIIFSHVFVYMSILNPKISYEIYQSGFLAALGFAGWMLPVILKNRRQLLSLRICILAIVVSLSPFIIYLASMIKFS